MVFNCKYINPAPEYTSGAGFAYNYRFLLPFTRLQPKKNFLDNQLCKLYNKNV